MKNWIKFFLVWILIVALGVTAGCATATQLTTNYGPDGKITSTVKHEIKRPVFAAMSHSWTNTTGVMNASSSVQLDQLMTLAIQGYARYLSGGLAVPQAPLVPSTIMPPLVPTPDVTK